jgi:hypothetical protein
MSQENVDLVRKRELTRWGEIELSRSSQVWTTSRLAEAAVSADATFDRENDSATDLGLVTVHTLV